MLSTMELYIHQIPLKKKKTTENLLADLEYPNEDEIRGAFDLMLQIVICKMRSPKCIFNKCRIQDL